MMPADSLKIYVPWGFVVGFIVYALAIMFFYLLASVSSQSYAPLWQGLIEVGQYLYPNELLKRTTSYSTAEADQIALYFVLVFWLLQFIATIAQINKQHFISVTGFIISSFITSAWFLGVSLLWLLAGLKM